MRKIALVVFISCSLLRAASPQEEARLVAAVQKAFAAHDANALSALTWWDRVTEKMKVTGKQRYEREVVLTATDIKLSNPDPALPDLKWKDATGTYFRSNLPVTKHLKITFAPGSSVKVQAGMIKVKDVTYPVGEKEGKLYLLQPAPVK